jgi:hypothetical protein
VLRRSLRGPERLSFFGGAPAWVSASYAYFGLFSVGSAWLYYLVTLDLLPAQPLARALGALAYESQSPMHMAPFVFALVELGCRRSRPVSRLALRMTLWTLGGVAAGFVVGMEWPLSRVLEVLANTIALLHGAALLRAGAVRDDAPRAADQEPAAA